MLRCTVSLAFDVLGGVSWVTDSSSIASLCSFFIHSGKRVRKVPAVLMAPISVNDSNRESTKIWVVPTEQFHWLCSFAVTFQQGFGANSVQTSVCPAGTPSVGRMLMENWPSGLLEYRCCCSGFGKVDAGPKVVAKSVDFLSVLTMWKSWYRLMVQLNSWDNYQHLYHPLEESLLHIMTVWYFLMNMKRHCSYIAQGTCSAQPLFGINNI